MAFAGVLLALFTPLDGLSAQGHGVVMALLVGVGLWSFQPGKLPFAVSTCIVMALLLVVDVSPKQVFAGFTSDAIWILLPATAFGYVLTKTGLGKRIALLVIKSFKPTYLNMTAAWLIIGLILSAFTPSILIRIAIVMPIAVACASMLGREPSSSGNAYILLIAWAMAIVPGSGWLTGSLWGPIMASMIARVPGLEGAVDGTVWLQVMALPMFLLTILILAGTFLVLRPERLSGLSRDAFADAYRELGPWSREEKVATVILVLTFVMFFTELKIPLLAGGHGIPATAICLGAFFAFFAFRVLAADDLSTGIAWNLVIFLGGVLGLPVVFRDPGVGVSAWIESLDLLAPFGQSAWLFVLLALLLMFVWRFFDIAWMIPTIAILVLLLPTIQSRFGIHPLVASSLMIMAGNFAFLAYMQPFAFIGSTLSGERSWTPTHLLKYGVVYLVACTITLVVSMFYWQATGFVQ